MSKPPAHLWLALAQNEHSSISKGHPPQKPAAPRIARIKIKHPVPTAFHIPCAKLVTMGHYFLVPTFLYLKYINLIVNDISADSDTLFAILFSLLFLEC